MDGLTGALEMVKSIPGKDFEVVVVSIDPDRDARDCGARRKRST